MDKDWATRTDQTGFEHLDWLPKNAAYVDVESNNVKVIETPIEFYQTIMELIERARQRISISTLYVGSSNYEEELVCALEKALNRNANMKINILLDYLRGTRGGSENSSVSVLQRLVPRASVYLFHTPNLRGLKKKILPERVNEVIGLQHMKLLVFDNNVIITGANLSKTYFTNRQDRYILIENCPQLADFVDSLIEAVGSCSFVLNMRGTTKLANKCFVHPFEGNLCAFKKMLYNRVMTAVNTLNGSHAATEFTVGTRIFPLIQMGIVSINQEFEYLQKLLSQQDRQLSLTMSSGYFNFTDRYIDLITNHSCYDMNIVYPSPQANGFHQAPGLSSFIPQMYVYISKLFFQTTRSKVRLFEYDRKGWSYHAKGLWIESKHLPFSGTVIGSSNFGHRSVHRDLEAQFLIITSNERLKRSLQEERSRMLENAIKVDADTFLRHDHFIPFWVRLISRLIRNYF